MQTDAIQPQPTISVSSGDRLCFTVFLAIALHALLVLGVSFELLRQTNQSPVIEVTLSHNPTEEEPEQADYMAQSNQIGGGELEQKALPSVTQPTEYIEQQINEVSPESPEPARPLHEQAQTAVVTAVNQTELQATDQHRDTTEDSDLERVSEEISLLERSLELASLDAKLDAREQVKTKNNRVHKIASVSALKTTDAYYVKQWINKIHRIGKLNYPEEARRRKLYGSLRLTVSLLPNGSVKGIQVLRSSGHKILDDAAIRIVRLAEPFAPFPEELARDYDRLEITRTWEFSRDGHSPVL